MIKIGRNNKNNYTDYKNNKLGQIETFGLAFIVILISVGFFMFVSFKSRQPVDNPQLEYTTAKLSEDFMLSIHDVDVKDCGGLTIFNLLVDCARDKRVICDNGLTSCVAVNESITILVNETFNVRYKTKFRFYSEGIYDDNDNMLINITNLNCTEKYRQAGAGKMRVPLHPDPRVVYLNMNICY